MNTNKLAIIQTACIGVFSLLLLSCGDSKEGGQGGGGQVEVESQVTEVFVPNEPAGAISVTEARMSASPGETVTVSGKIAGAMSPFTEGFSTLVLADNELETCDLIPGDACNTPWDACCVEPETIKSLRMTVQIVGDDGRPIPQSLSGVNGLKELDKLIVTGTVAEGSTKENLILNATAVFQQPESL